MFLNIFTSFEIIVLKYLDFEGKIIGDLQTIILLPQRIIFFTSNMFKYPAHIHTLYINTKNSRIYFVLSEYYLSLKVPTSII